MLRTHLVGGDGVLIAATAYTEVIVRPLQDGTHAKVDEFLSAMGAQVVAVDRAAARRAARLRARRLPDAFSPGPRSPTARSFRRATRSQRRIADRESEGQQSR